MKIVVSQFRVPEWPYARPPEFKNAIHPVADVTGPDDRMEIRAEPGFQIAAVFVVADDDAENLIESLTSAQQAEA